MVCVDRHIVGCSLFTQTGKKHNENILRLKADCLGFDGKKEEEIAPGALGRVVCYLAISTASTAKELFGPKCAVWG